MQVHPWTVLITNWAMLLPNNIAQFLFSKNCDTSLNRLFVSLPKESQMTLFKMLNILLVDTCTCSPINLCHHQMNTCRLPPATSTTTPFYEWTKGCTLTPCVCASGQFFELICSDPITACFWAVWRVDFFSSSLSCNGNRVCCLMELVQMSHTYRFICKAV